MITNNIKKLVFDIETAGFDYNGYDDYTKKQIAKLFRADPVLANEEPQVNGKFVKDLLGLTPLTAQIVALGILDLDTSKSYIYYQNSKVAQKEHRKEMFRLFLLLKREFRKFLGISQKLSGIYRL